MDANNTIENVEQPTSKNPAGRSPQLFKLSERKKELGLATDSWDITKMMPRHFQILDLFLQGKKFGEIASIVGISNQRVSQIYNSPAFQDQLARRRRSIEDKVDSAVAVSALSNSLDVHKKLKQLSERAVSKLETLMESEDENVQFRSAADILDRSGFAKVSRLESESKAAVVVLDAALIATLKQTLLEDKDDSDSGNELEIISEPVEEVEENLEKPDLTDQPDSEKSETDRFVSPLKAGDYTTRA